MKIKKAENFPIEILRDKELEDTIEYLMSILSAHDANTMTVTVMKDSNNAMVIVDSNTVILEVE